MKISKSYLVPELRELGIRLEGGFASSVSGGIDGITEETGAWD